MILERYNKYSGMSGFFDFLSPQKSAQETYYENTKKSIIEKAPTWTASQYLAMKEVLLKNLNEGMLTKNQYNELIGIMNELSQKKVVFSSSTTSSATSSTTKTSTSSIIPNTSTIPVIPNSSTLPENSKKNLTIKDFLPIIILVAIVILYFIIRKNKDNE